jgi:hypothetical protein
MRHGQGQQMSREIKSLLPLLKTWNVSWLKHINVYGRILEMNQEHLGTLAATCAVREDFPVRMHAIRRALRKL